MNHELNELRKLNASNDLISFEPQSKYKLGTTAANAIQADSTLLGSVDDNERGGWLFTKTVAGTDKFNCYFFAPNAGENMTLAHLRSMSAVVSIDNVVENKSLPFFAVYTQATGTNDAGAWYHSKIVGSLNVSSQYISTGEKIQMYFNGSPTVSYGFRKLKTLKTIYGEGLNTEPIIAISFHSDSGAPVGTQILLSDFTYETLHSTPIVRTFKLIS